MMVVEEKERSVCSMENLMLRLSLLCLMINICLRGAEQVFNSPGISEIMFDHAPTTTKNTPFCRFS